MPRGITTSGVPVRTLKLGIWRLLAVAILIAAIVAIMVAGDASDGSFLVNVGARWSVP